MFRLFIPLFLLLFGLAGTTAQHAHAGSFLISVNPGGKELPLAIPAPMRIDDADPEVASTVWTTLRRDLDMTGYFTIIDPAAYIEQDGDVEPGSFQLNDWRVVGAAAVAKTRVSLDQDILTGDVFVYDVATGEKLVGKRFTSPSTEARRVAHKMADAVLAALTGQTSFFGTQIAAIGAGTGNKEVYLMDFDGHGKRAVTRNGSINLSPAWSPDGSAVVFTSYKRNNPDLYVKDLRSGRSRVLSAKQGINTGGAFSPDGSRVALTRSTAGDSDIYILDARTGEQLQRITTGGGIDVSPAWSPSGNLLAFSSERSGGSQIFVYDLTSKKTRRVTFAGSFNFDPVFHPDGDRIAFVGRSDSGFNVFTVGIDGKGMRPITQDQGDNEDPSWSPDGRYLMFSSTRTGWTQPAWGP
jgi:TolB protein